MDPKVFDRSNQSNRDDVIALYELNDLERFEVWDPISVGYALDGVIGFLHCRY